MDSSGESIAALFRDNKGTPKFDLQRILKPLLADPPTVVCLISCPSLPPSIPAWSAVPSEFSHLQLRSDMIDNVPNWFFSTCVFIGFVLCMIPLPWHLEGLYILPLPHTLSDAPSDIAWNTGTCLYMIWTGLACLNQFINSVAWNTGVLDKAPVWCDICTRSFFPSVHFGRCSPGTCSHQICNWQHGGHSCRVSLHQPSPVLHRFLSDSDEDPCTEAARCHD